MSFSADWQKFVDRFDPSKFRPRLAAEAKKGMQKVGREATRVAVKKIKAKEYAPNSPRTLKGKEPRTTPLINHGDLVGSIGFDIIQAGDTIMVLGANKSVPGKDERVNIVATLHEGTKDKRIPPRPFLQRAVDSQEVQDKFEEVIGEVVGNAVRP